MHCAGGPFTSTSSVQAIELRAGAGVEDESCREATERVIRNSQFARGAGRPHRRRRIGAELLGVPVEHWWVSTLAGSYAGGTWG
ncbi:MAG: hypothetical protein ACE5OS_13580 [Anaerolineae bacterium]